MPANQPIRCFFPRICHVLGIVFRVFFRLMRLSVTAPTTTPHPSVRHATSHDAVTGITERSAKLVLSGKPSARRVLRSAAIAVLGPLSFMTKIHAVFDVIQAFGGSLMYMCTVQATQRMQPLYKSLKGVARAITLRAMWDPTRQSAPTMWVMVSV